MGCLCNLLLSLKEPCMSAGSKAPYPGAPRQPGGLRDEYVADLPYRAFNAQKVP
jgi:hypothetical protein